MEIGQSAPPFLNLPMPISKVIGCEKRDGEKRKTMNKIYTIKGLYVGKIGEEVNPTYYGTLDGAIRYASNSNFTHYGEDLIICIGDEDFAIQKWLKKTDDVGEYFESEDWVKISKRSNPCKSKKNDFEKARDLWFLYLDCIGEIGKENDLIQCIYQLGYLMAFESEEERKEWIRSAIHYEERRYEDFDWELGTEKRILKLKEI